MAFISVRVMRRAVLLVTGLCISCEKAELVPTKTALLAQQKWVLSAWSVSPAFPLYYSNGTLYKTYTNMYEYWQATSTTCPLDRHLTFAQGDAQDSYELGAYSFRQGQATCGSYYVAQKGSWYTQASGGATLLYLLDERSKPFSSIINNIYTVNELSGDKLTLQYKQQQAGSATVYTFTLFYTPE